MKKLLKIIFFMHVFFIMPNITEAAVTSTITTEAIPNVKVAIKSDNDTTIYSMSKIIANRTNELIYSHHPNATSSNTSYTEVQMYSEINGKISLSEEDWKHAQYFNYFGYNYSTRTTIDWYIATQYLIWDYLIEEDIYFVDENNQKIDLYQEEINTIKKDVAEMYIYPSFAKTSFGGNLEHYKINATITLTDTNNVLHKFNIEAGNGITYQVDGNKLTLTFKNPGQSTVQFPSIGIIRNIPRIYYNSDGTFFISKGHIPAATSNVSYFVDYPTISINSKIEDDVPLTNSSYGVYMSDGTLYDILTADENNIYTPRPLLQGDYYLEQISPAPGYLPNPDKSYFTINEEDVVINIKETPIKKNLNLTSYLVNSNNEETPNANTTFELYKNDKLIDTVTTSDDGELYLSLTFGTYTLKEITENNNYTYNAPLVFEINENWEEEQTIKKYEITGSLTLTKIDSKTTKPILEETSYKILNTTTNTYLKINGEDTFKSKDGLLTIENIPIGTYQIEEITPSSNYHTSKPLEFTIKSNDNLSLTLEANPKPTSISSNNNTQTTEKPTTTLTTTLDTNKNTTNPDNNRLKIDIPLTGTNEFLIAFLISVILLLFGTYLCNHGEKN